MIIVTATPFSSIGQLLDQVPTESNQLADTNKELERAPEVFLDTSVNQFERQILTRRRTPAPRYNVDPVASALDRLEPSERSLRGNALSLRPFRQRAVSNR